MSAPKQIKVVHRGELIRASKMNELIHATNRLQQHGGSETSISLGGGTFRRPHTQSQFEYVLLATDLHVGESAWGWIQIRDPNTGQWIPDEYDPDYPSQHNSTHPRIEVWEKGWMTETITAGTEVSVNWHAKAGIWVVTGAPCENASTATATGTGT